MLIGISCDMRRKLTAAGNRADLSPCLESDCVGDCTYLVKASEEIYQACWTKLRSCGGRVDVGRRKVRGGRWKVRGKQT